MIKIRKTSKMDLIFCLFVCLVFNKMLTPGVAWVCLLSESVPPNSFGRCQVSPRKKMEPVYCSNPFSFLKLNAVKGCMFTSGQLKFCLRNTF